MGIYIALALIGMHFFADYIFQLPKSGSYNGTYPTTLVTHCLLYSLPFMFFGAQFFVVVLCTHWLVDFSIDAILKKLWDTKNTYHHRMMVGFDQSSHIAILFIIYWLLMPVDSPLGKLLGKI